MEGNITIEFVDANAALLAGCGGDTGVLVRLWNATDECGNVSTCEQEIVIEDATQPILTCPADITLSCGEAFDPSIAGQATATDNCSSLDNIAITFVDQNDGILNQCNNTTGVITRIWTAVDACGNEATCQQLITIEDNEIPNLICPPDVTLTCDQSIDPSIAGGFAIAADNCTATDDLEITFEDSNGGALGECGGNSGVITRTYTVVDACGNVATCQQTITVIDDTAPVLTCAPNLTISCDQSREPGTTGQATATDNCSGTTDITITFADSDNGTATGCGGSAGTFTRVWTAVDACGNESTCEQLITIEDNEIPNLICPPDVTLTCDQSIDPSIAAVSYTHLTLPTICSV